MPLWTRVFAIVSFTCLAGTVNAGLIDFEEFGTQPSLFSNQEPLDSEYSSLGVNFSGGWEIVNERGGFGVNARSGEHFAAYNTLTAGITDTLTIEFDGVVNSASGFLGDLSPTSWVVTAYLGLNEVSLLNLVNPFQGYVEFSFNSLAFDHITIQGSSNAAVLDDLSFETNSVPSPSTIALLGLGIAGMGLTRRRGSI